MKERKSKAELLQQGLQCSVAHVAIPAAGITKAKFHDLALISSLQGYALSKDFNLPVREKSILKTRGVYQKAPSRSSPHSSTKAARSKHSWAAGK